jgi:hypothetical protein
MKSIHTFVTAFIVLIVTAHPAHAQLIILGNLPPTNDSFVGVVTPGTPEFGFTHVAQAISFTMPPQSYPVERATLRLRLYNLTEGDVAAVGFYADDGNDRPGPLVGSLLVSPPSNSDAFGEFNFTPSTPLTLVGSTKYWLMADATAGIYQWHGSSPSIVPSSQVGATFGKMISIVDDVPRDVNIGVASFEIVAFPEPATNLLILGMVAGFAMVRRRGAKSRSA